MDYADLTRRLRARTEPSPIAVARVRSRLDRALLPATPELSRLPQVSTAAVARVKARLAVPQPHPRPATAWLGAGLAFAAVSVLAGWWSLTGEPAAHAELSMSGAGVDQLDRLVLTHDGQGHAVADGGRVQVDWEYGRLGLDAPGDLALTVVTPEGAVSAGEGGSLVVVRDAVGTRIEVARGSAEVRCGDAPPTMSSGATQCDPTTATGWLTRARAHQSAGVGTELVLADVDHGLVDADGPVESELLTLRTNLLVSAGRNAEAIDAAEGALAVTSDPVRLQDLHRTAARLALVAGDCDRALPHLAVLSEPTADERAYRERCASR